jgi:hypothetical protein
VIASDFESLFPEIGRQSLGILDGQGVNDSGLAFELGRQQVRQFVDAALVSVGLRSDLGKQRNTLLQNANPLKKK